MSTILQTLFFLIRFYGFSPIFVQSSPSLDSRDLSPLSYSPTYNWFFGPLCWGFESNFIFQSRRCKHLIERMAAMAIRKGTHLLKHVRDLDLLNKMPGKKKHQKDDPTNAGFSWAIPNLNLLKMPVRKVKIVSQVLVFHGENLIPMGSRSPKT